jgi:hypothetical protein
MAGMTFAGSLSRATDRLILEVRARYSPGSWCHFGWAFICCLRMGEGLNTTTRRGERGQHVLEGPARGALAFPGVVISLCAARPHHRVDGAAATEDTPERHVELAVVQLRNRRDRQRPVERTANIVEPDAGIADRRAGILASRFHEQNVGARRGELASNDRAGRTAKVP